MPVNGLRAIIFYTASALGILFLVVVHYRTDDVWTRLAPFERACQVLKSRKCRVLLTDIIFPSVYGRWRLNEVQQFMEFFYTDVLVCQHANVYFQLKFTFDWEPLFVSHHLGSYDILIFDPNYNYLQKYNDPSFNGTAFNHRLPASYMLRLRVFRLEDVDIHAYDSYYHIFVMCYTYFAARFNDTNSSRHVIHFYPGGGTLDQFKAIPNETTLVPSQHYLSDFISAQGRSNPVFPVMGGPLLRKNEPLRPKDIKLNGSLVACFTSVGGVAQKGADVYVQLAEMYARRHNGTNSSWVFYGVGNIPPSNHVKILPYMSQSELDTFYARHVDAVFNLVRYVSSWSDGAEGFPLGGEAVNAGSLLFSTDQLDSNNRNQFFFPDGFIRVDLQHPELVIDKLDNYAQNRYLLHRHSTELQRAYHRVFQYENQSGRILRHMRDRFCPCYQEHRGKAFCNSSVQSAQERECAGVSI